jgi:signal peptidase I
LAPHVSDGALSRISSIAPSTDKEEEFLAAKKKPLKTAPEPAGKDQQPAKPKETAPEFIASMAILALTALFIITFVLQNFQIPSSSMENTLLIGDHLLVDRILLAPPTRWIDKLIPYREPQHGDIFVFISPAQPGLYLVKRVMGLPGDHIRLQDGVVYRNGVRLNEPYVNRCDDKMAAAGMCSPYDPYRDNFPQVPPSMGDNLFPKWQMELPSNIQNGEVVVPPGKLFAMGDNRDVSYDSRFWGFVPRENVIGRPMFVYWSFVTPRDEYERQGLGDRLAWMVNIVVHFFDHTRWSRTFHVVH